MTGITEENSLPIACCLNDGEPLISTYRYPGGEFVCMVCGHVFGFLDPVPKTETPELTARYEELKARWDAGETPGVKPQETPDGK